MNSFDWSPNYKDLTALYDATLAHLKTPYQVQWVETSFGKTHLISAGPEYAPPVLLLHGSASNAAACWPLINGLSATYRVIAPDIPRQLGKTEPFRLSTRNTAYGKWLEEILDHLAISRTNVVGFSFGGWIACKLARSAPDRIGKIVLLSPIGLVPFRFQYWMRAPLLLLNMLAFRTDPSIRKFATLLAGPTASEDIVEEMVVSTKVYLKNFYMQAVPWFIKKKTLKALTAPMLLLVGRHDTFFKPERIVARVRECLPNAQTEIIEDTGHVVYFEKPDFVSARILEFLTSKL